MTLEEIKGIVELALRLDDLDDPRQMDNFCDNVYDPVKAAIVSNDKTVIDYISKCTPIEMRHVYTAVANGAKKSKHKEAIQLYLKICEECDYKVKDWAKEFLDL